MSERRDDPDPWGVLPLTAREAQLVLDYRQLSPKLQRAAERLVRSVSENNDLVPPTKAPRRRGKDRRGKDH
jgi:hypothetical protein